MTRGLTCMRNISATFLGDALVLDLALDGRLAGVHVRVLENVDHDDHLIVPVRRKMSVSIRVAMGSGEHDRLTGNAGCTIERSRGRHQRAVLSARHVALRRYIDRSAGKDRNNQYVDNVAR